jgi:nitroreductase
MKIIEALKWRYAAKRMNGNSIPKAKLETILKAISLAPSSYGLQPYSIIVVQDPDILEKIKPIASMQPQITEASAVLVFAAWDNLTQERIDNYITLITKVREVTQESLLPMKRVIESQLAKTEEQSFNWNARQAYIALGIALVAAAEENIDSTPMEGFEPEKLDEILQLKEKGLKSVVLLALGYRDEKTDYLVDLKKVRREESKLFTTLN